MPDEVRLAAAFAVAAGMTWLAVPIAIRIAVRTEFYDVPRDYKGHERPTPYLGGLALVAGFAVAALAFGSAAGRFAPVLACALAMLALGTLDDRVAVRPMIRIVAEIGVGIVLYATDLGFSALPSSAANLALTIVFVLGVVNAYNLLDNIDGAAASVGGASAAALGVLAVSEGSVGLGALALALAGACAGFLPRNLSNPARQFLGDGGSMPLGMIIAATIMSFPDTGGLGWAVIPVAILLVGIPALDTSLVVVSRLLRGAKVYHGARDHLTHRLLARLGSPRRVAVVLAFAQACASVAGAELTDANPAAAAALAGVVILAGLGVIASLERPRRAPTAQSAPV